MATDLEKLKNGPLSNLMNAVEEAPDSVWEELETALLSRHPFSFFKEWIGELEGQISEIKKENKKLQSLIRLHKHMGDDVVTKI